MNFQKYDCMSIYTISIKYIFAGSKITLCFFYLIGVPRHAQKNLVPNIMMEGNWEESRGETLTIHRLNKTLYMYKYQQ